MTFLAVAVYIQMFQISARRWCGRGIKLVWALMLPLMLPLVLQYEHRLKRLKVRKRETTSMHVRMSVCVYSALVITWKSN